MEFFFALTRLQNIQPFGGMGDLCMVSKTSLFLPILSVIVCSY